MIVYAAFAHGAVARPTRRGSRSRWRRSRRSRPARGCGAGRSVAAPRLALAGSGCFAFAAWSGISLAWSVAPDQTWIELNRAITYVLVLCLGGLAGSSTDAPFDCWRRGSYAIVLAVTAYALGQKLLPGLHVPGLFNLNQTGPLPRLQEPFGYWNALGLFLAMGVPIALVLTCRPDALAQGAPRASSRCSCCW